MVQSLTQTVYLICELLTEEPEGGSDTIPFETFKELYTYLAQMNCGSSDKEKAAMGKQDASDGTVANIKLLFLYNYSTVIKHTKNCCTL